MTRIRVPVGVLVLAMAVLAVVSVVALPVAAADLPFRGPAAGSVLPGTPVEIDVDGLLPGDELAPLTLALPAADHAPFRLTAVATGSTLLARSIGVRIVSPGGAVLYAGPLASAVASGVATADAGSLAVSMRLDPRAGNEVQGERLTVRWDLRISGATD